ncbi:MAG: hypothetical protein ACFFCP_12415 [Promethearchaeota archaeon]
MNEEIDLVKIEQATFRTANQDGLTEVWMGLMICSMALVLIQTAFASMVAFLIIFQAAFNERVKEKFTYPRIGRVKLRGEAEMPSGYGWLLVIAVMVPAFASVVFSTRIENEILSLVARWAPVLIGLGIIQPAAYLVERSGLNRYYWTGAVSAILGLAFTLVEFPSPVSRMILYLFLVGVVFIIAGLTSLTRFVRKYPILELEEEVNERDQ